MLGKIKENRNDFIIIAATMIITIAAIFLSSIIFEGGFLKDKLNKNVEYYKAEVIEISEEKIEEDKYIDGIYIGLQEIDIKILEGKEKGCKYSISNSVSRLYNTRVKVGSKIIVAIYYGDDGKEISDISISSFKRSHILLIMIIMFFILIFIIGGIKGIKSIVSLLFTIVSIVYIMLPLMLKGISPVLSSTIVAVISTVVTLVLVSGVNKKSLCTIGGTIIGVLSAGILAHIFGNLANLSGINMSDAESIMYIAENTDLKVHGIMYAGILISSLGAVMDVSMSIASSIFEIYSLNNSMKVKELFKSGMNIGRDIIGTMSNTLILAFAGGSLNTLIMIYSSEMTSNRLFNLDIIGTELIQGLSGSMGVILTVPITAIISAYLCRKDK